MHRLIATCLLLSLTLFAAEELPKTEPGRKKLPDPPPARTRAEVDSVLKLSGPTPDPATLRPLKILLLAGVKDHGVGEHDYPWWQKNWQPFLQKMPKVTVDTAFTWPTPEQLSSADLLVCFFRSPWEEEKLKQIDGLLARGAGVVLIHQATGPQTAGTAIRCTPEQFASRFGMGSVSVYYRHGPMELKLEKPDHPILKGLPQVISLIDESYWPLAGDETKCDVLATSEELKAKGVPVKAPFPQVWTTTRGKARTFNFIPGHFNHSFNDAFVRIMLLRGMAWAANEQVNRFDALATDGLELK
jgi:type 1 glutamine amidotransferase